MKRLVVLVVMVTLVGLLGGQAATAAKVRHTALKVALLEFSITANRDAVPPGKVTFVVRNKGTVTHELVLVKGTPWSLPIVKVATPDRSVGAVDEEASPSRPRRVKRATSSPARPSRRR